MSLRWLQYFSTTTKKILKLSEPRMMRIWKIEKTCNTVMYHAKMSINICTIPVWSGWGGEHQWKWLRAGVTSVADQASSMHHVITFITHNYFLRLMSYFIDILMEALAQNSLIIVKVENSSRKGKNSITKNLIDEAISLRFNLIF